VSMLIYYNLLMTLSFCVKQIFKIFWPKKNMLRFFEMTSSLRVNFHKIKIGALGVDKNVLLRFSYALNCNTMEIPF